MIDTDKYEGHTPAPWTIELGNMEEYGETDTVMSSEGEVAMNVMRQDVALLADAPLLLAEVKRLQERLDWILGDEELAGYVWEKEVAYMEWEGVRLPWISADEWGEEE
jgi:hypothetical protein